ncbi:N-acetylgalactosamine-6-sulfatase [Verrucomicrobiota bacterium]|nr:N-acetylgalactosamine-6-sulfatase [Verrucomicrobiota bacterium]
MKFSFALLFAALFASLHAADKPNIIFVLVDDAGIGDFSPYGCKYGVTPNIDRLANEGMKFTRAYSGSAVCAPSRCVLMTGQHTGHALRRANQSNIGLLSLPSGQKTVASLLHGAGYATGGFGKWGLGNPGSTGAAEKQGFDVFFGYYDQKHAHDYYTDHLVKNGVDVPQPQSGKHTWEDYSHTRIADETLKFIEQNKNRPFFCYAAWTPPHGDFVIPENPVFGQKAWTEEVRNYAAMVALVDKDVGRLMKKLKDLGIDEKTLVVFSSDNGANLEFIESLGSTGGLRGYKRMLYEGGMRTPFIARWPGKIQPSTTSDLLTSSVDFLPTAAELSGVPGPKGLDGHSILPTLLGKGQQVVHASLYFEIYEPYFQQAVRMGDWKGYRLGTKAPLELYDLKSDPAEKQNIAAAHPDIVKRIEAIMTAEHTPSPHYDAPEQGKARASKAMKKASLPELLNEETKKTK